MRRRTPAVYLAVASCLSLTGCSPRPSTERVTASTEAIIRGTPGGPDAVGHVFPMSNTYDFCTGTLVAPDLVLTAKHCIYVNEDSTQGLLMDQDTVAFTLADTNDASQWTDAVPVSEVYVSPDLPPPPNPGDWWFDYVSDTAVYRLSQPINTATPIPIGVGMPSASNPDFVAVGFGRVDHAGTDAKSRNTGPLTFAQNGGSQLRSLFPTVGDYVNAVDQIVPGYPTQDLANEYQHEVMAQDNEVWFYGPDTVPKDVQGCNGDSGGPLLQQVAGQWQVFGVVSGSKSYGSVRCYWGTVYAVFGPEVLTFFQSVGALPPQPLDAGSPPAPAPDASTPAPVAPPDGSTPVDGPDGGEPDSSGSNDWGPRASAGCSASASEPSQVSFVLLVVAGLGALFRRRRS